MPKYFLDAAASDGSKGGKRGQLPVSDFLGRALPPEPQGMGAEAAMKQALYDIVLLFT